MHHYQNQEMIKKVWGLVFSSWRPMPAYFTGDNSREKTFGVDFADLTADEESAMAGIAYYSVPEFVKGLENTFQSIWLVRLGEDAIIGAYIITKLNRADLAYDLERVVTESNIDRFRGAIDSVDVDRVYTLEGVSEYIKYCVEEGKRLARAESE